MNDDVRHLLRQFGLPPHVLVHSLGNAGGMSGAALWRIDSHPYLCLRRWPEEHPSLDQLQWIHRQMQRAFAAGCHFVPQLRTSRDGKTIVSHANCLWELTTWQLGVADYHQRRSPVQLRAALSGLARFHQATADDHHPLGPSPGLDSRRRRLNHLQASEFEQLRRAIDQSPPSPLSQAAKAIVDQTSRIVERTRGIVDGACHLSTELQPCLRDVWHDHLLFQGDVLTGLIDFGAMHIESPCGDVARLLGSLAGNDRGQWEAGMAAYESVRPLPDKAIHLLAAFDAANITLSGLNWVQWLYVDQREFEDLARIATRLQEIYDRMEQLILKPTAHRTAVASNRWAVCLAV